MPTPKIVAEHALKVVRQLNLPAYNWPNVPKKDKLKNKLVGHKISAAHQAGLVDKKGEKKLKKQAGGSVFGDKKHVLLPIPSSDQAVAMGQYFSTGNCPVLNCGE